MKNLSFILPLLEENFAVSIIDRTGTITYVNEIFCSISKYDADELIGQTYGIINPKYSTTSTLSEIELDIAKNKMTQRIIKGQAKDKTPFWVRATIMPIPSEDGRTTQFLSFDVNITERKLTEEKYKNTLDYLHNIENALDQSTVIAITDQRGIITHVNEKFCEISQYNEEELIGQTHQLINSGYHEKSFFKDMWRTIGTGQIWEGEVKNRAKNGSEYWMQTTIVPFLNDNGKPYQYISIRTDITSKKESEYALQIALKNDFRNTVKNLQNAIFKYTSDCNRNIKFTLLEGKTVEKLDLTTDNIIEKITAHNNSDSILNHYRKVMENALRGNASQFELVFKNDTFLVYLSPIFENDEVVEVVGTATDISKRKQDAKVIEHMAFYDYLTGLPNRRLFQKTVNDLIRLGESPSFAIMFIDLDRFKNVNDSMGHSVGDQLLKLVGERLQKWVRKSDIVSRHGGDEYVILLPSSNASDAETVAASILQSLSKAFTLNNIDIYISSSIGISVYPEDGPNYETLIGHADSAMYLAKESGKNNYQFFTNELHLEIIEKNFLEMDLRQALQKEQFTLHYQPLIDLKSGKLNGLEALIRWEHPIKGMISPVHFIPIAEESGLIIPIGKWVLMNACTQVKKWQEKLGISIQINVNVSIHQFKQSSFVADVKETLLKTGLEARFLNLEITESMTADGQSCQTTLHELRTVGINVSIDDFGTGYSSLSYLSKFPITHLKIDRMFVHELSKSNRAIVKTIISLAKNLHLNVIAEGVETEEQATFLKQLNCDEAQGFLYSKPLPEHEVEAILNEKFF